MSWQTKTGGQLATLVRKTEEGGGPRPSEYEHMRSFWCAAAQYWYYIANGGTKSAKGNDFRTDDQGD